MAAGEQLPKMVAHSDGFSTFTPTILKSRVFRVATLPPRVKDDRTLPTCLQMLNPFSKARDEELRRWTKRATFHRDDRNRSHRSGQINRQHRNRHVFGGVAYHRFRKHSQKTSGGEKGCRYLQRKGRNGCPRNLQARGEECVGND